MTKRGNRSNNSLKESWSPSCGRAGGSFQRVVRDLVGAGLFLRLIVVEVVGVVVIHSPIPIQGCPDEAPVTDLQAAWDNH